MKTNVLKAVIVVAVVFSLTVLLAVIIVICKKKRGKELKFIKEFHLPLGHLFMNLIKKCHFTVNLRA